jgi:hypothetical protein
MTMLIETARVCSENAIEYWDGNLTDLRDLVEELEADGQKFAANLAGRLVRHIKEVVEQEELCPQCFAKLEVITEKEQVGFYGSAPAYQDVVVRLECPSCNYEEAV